MKVGEDRLELGSFGVSGCGVWELGVRVYPQAFWVVRFEHAL